METTVKSPAATKPAHPSTEKQDTPTVELMPVQSQQGISPQLHPASFTTFGLWRGNGLLRINFTNGGINANSRVFAAISEYNTDARVDRFQGDAQMFILNVTPHNGGVIVLFNVVFNRALNIRIDLLVDPSAI